MDDFDMEVIRVETNKYYPWMVTLALGLSSWAGASPLALGMPGGSWAPPGLPNASSNPGFVGF